MDAAEAGIHWGRRFGSGCHRGDWIPAFAGMTMAGARVVLGKPWY
jgi:hypothetical protein